MGDPKSLWLSIPVELHHSQHQMSCKAGWDSEA